MILNLYLCDRHFNNVNCWFDGATLRFVGWKCNTVGWTMLKRERERLVQPLLGFYFHLPILHVLLWFYSLYENSCDFFLKCAVHISLTELIKGNECFKSTSAFLFIVTQLLACFSDQYTLVPCYYSISCLAFSPCLTAFPYSWAHFNFQVMCTFCSFPCLLSNGKGRGGDLYNEHSEMKSDMRLH